MAPRASLLLLVTLTVALLGVGTNGTSSAAYTASTGNTGTVSAAADWTVPTVSVTSPGALVSGTVAVTATASDGESGIASVTIERATTSAGPWTPLCTTGTAPYACSWNTTAVADGGYLLRARATDGAGYSATSGLVGTTVLNSAGVTLADPGDPLRGTVPVSATVTGGAAATSITLARRTAGTGAWTTICSTTNALRLDCAWSTGTLTGFYDLRAQAVVAGTPYTSLLTDILVDNAAPAVTLADPGSPLSGTRTFAATAGDADSGVAAVTFQYTPAGSSSWTTMCVSDTDPFACAFNTLGLADGSYDFRAVATDVAGNTTASASVRRDVNNTVASVSLADPGSPLSGTVALNAAASSPYGVASVAVERRTSPSGAWTTVCTVTSAPYTCAWDTKTVTDGAYDLRAVLTDSNGGTLPSAIVPARQVDNSPLRGLDVQAANGAATLGRLETGDTLTLTYSDAVAPGTVTSGWTGAATAVTVRVTNSGNSDGLSVLTAAGAAVNLGTVNLRANHVTATTSFTGSTLTATTDSSGGVPRTVVRITLGTATSTTGLRTTTSPARMVWTPSAAARDVDGIACSTTAVTESGTNDKDF